MTIMVDICSHFSAITKHNMTHISFGHTQILFTFRKSKLYICMSCQPVAGHKQSTLNESFNLLHSVFYTACQPGKQCNLLFHLQWESKLAQEVVYFSKKNIFCYSSYQSWQDTSQTHLSDGTSVYL